MVKPPPSATVSKETQTADKIGSINIFAKKVKKTICDTLTSAKQQLDIWRPTPETRSWKTYTWEQNWKQCQRIRKSQSKIKEGLKKKYQDAFVVKISQGSYQRHRTGRVE